MMTRVSPRAKKAVEQKLNGLQGVSASAYLRRLIYKDLGLLKEDSDA